MDEKFVIDYDNKPINILVPITIMNPCGVEYTTCMGCIDTGAEHTLIDDNLANELNLKRFNRVSVGGITGKIELHEIVLSRILFKDSNIYFNIFVPDWEFSIFSNGDFKLLIGMDIISKGDLILLNKDGNTRLIYECNVQGTPINTHLLEMNFPTKVKLSQIKKALSSIPPKSPRPSKPSRPSRTPSKRTEIDKALERMLGYDPKKDKRNKPNKK